MIAILCLALICGVCVAVVRFDLWWHGPRPPTRYQQQINAEFERIVEDAWPHP